MWFKYGLKAQKLQKQHALNQRSPAEGKGKGQKLSLIHICIRLQRNIEHSWNYIMWNIMKNSCSGIKEDWCCKGKSFVYSQVF